MSKPAASSEHLTIFRMPKPRLAIHTGRVVLIRRLRTPPVRWHVRRIRQAEREGDEAQRYSQRRVAVRLQEAEACNTSSLLAPFWRVSASRVRPHIHGTPGAGWIPQALHVRHTDKARRAKVEEEAQEMRNHTRTSIVIA